MKLNIYKTIEWNSPFKNGYFIIHDGLRNSVVKLTRETKLRSCLDWQLNCYPSVPEISDHFILIPISYPILLYLASSLYRFIVTGATISRFGCSIALFPNWLYASRCRLKITSIIWNAYIFLKWETRLCDWSHGSSLIHKLLRFKRELTQRDIMSIQRTSIQPKHLGTWRLSFCNAV